MTAIDTQELKTTIAQSKNDQKEALPPLSYTKEFISNHTGEINFEELDSTHPARYFSSFWGQLNNCDTPNKNQFFPEKIPSVLKWLMCFRLKDEGWYAFLQGGAVTELTKGSLQGKYLYDIIQGNSFHLRNQLFAKVIETGKPSYAVIDNYGWGSEFYCATSIGFFPFIENGNPVIFSVVAPISLRIRSCI